MFNVKYMYLHQAGLCSSDVHLKSLSEVAEGNQQPLANEAHPERLSLACESESAAIDCLRALRNSKENMLHSTTTKTYMIVDCGGGTVDIATHAITGGGVQELTSSAGIFKGGTNVNEEFKGFLAEFVDDPDFRGYLDIERSHRQASINKLIYTSFEEQKLRFGAEDGSESFLIDFPKPFEKKFGEKMEEKGSTLSNVQIEEEGSQMRLSPKKMAEFFKPTIDSIGSLIVNHLRHENLVNIDTVFWVGGFGGCKYLRSKLENKLTDEFPSKKYNFITPSKPHLAIIRGATVFRSEPEVIQERKSNATYGINCRIPFREDVHMPEYCEDDEEVAGKKWCRNVFSTLVRKNDSICMNKVFVADLVPTTRCQQNNVCFTIYCAPHKDVEYTDEDGVTELATIDLNIADYDRNRDVEVVFDITDTEVKISVREKLTEKEVKAVVDFLK